METHRQKSIEFKTHAHLVINDPPRLSEHTIRLIPLTESIANVNIYLHYLHSTNTLIGNEEGMSIIDNMIKLRDELLFNTLCDHYGSFISLVSMEQEHPTNGAMILYLCISYIEMVLDSLYNKTNGSIYPQSCNLSVKTKSSDITTIAQSCLCISGSLVCSYSTRELMQAVKILSMRWHEIDPTDYLILYLLGLIHRGFILMAKPGLDRVHDIPALRKLVSESVVSASGVEERPNIWGGNWDLLRRLSGGLARMLAIARFRLVNIDSRISAKSWYCSTMEIALNQEEEEEEAEFKKRTENISKALFKEAQKMGAIEKFRSELQDMFRISGTWFGDLDIFTEKCNMKPPKPRSVIFNSKQPDIQYTWNYLNQALSVVDLCLLNEEAPFFNQCFTFVHKFYAQNIKLYCAGVILKQSNVTFVGDFCVAEQEFIGNRHFIMTRSMSVPLLIQTFGCFQVLYKKTFYLSNSTEGTLLIWCTIVHKEENDMLEGKNVGASISKLLNETPSFSLGDVWKNSAIIQGELDL